MFRKITNALLQWKNSPHRKPLILQGARQVGKTYTLLEFGKAHYENVAYFNFETNPALIRMFDERIDPDYLLPLLSSLSGQTIIRERTLVIFDEVQLCERALTSLKYFYESAPEIHLVACGSLLGVAVNRKQFSFPVGKVELMTLSPMDMEEFLLAAGEGELVGQIRACFAGYRPMPEALHTKALDYYRQYLVVGGMPECAARYWETKDLLFVRHLQATLLAAYLSDMSKYNKENEIKKTRLVYDNITVQLSRQNTRFQYKLVKKGGRASEFENAIEWLALSGIVTRIYRAEQVKYPLENYRDIDAFKIYVSDCGLLCAKKEIFPETILYPAKALDDFRGSLTENYVCTQLKALEYQPYYWTQGSGGEIDFLIQRQGNVVPLEVKSSEHTQSKSLNAYIRTYKPDEVFRLSTKNFGFENGIKSIPLYSAFCL